MLIVDVLYNVLFNDVKVKDVVDVFMFCIKIYEMEDLVNVLGEKLN